MSEKEFLEMCELDDLAEEAGGYVDFTGDNYNSIHYDYRAILAYCKERKIEPIDMTIREMQQFVIA